MSAMLSRTRSRMSEILARLAPPSGTMLSTSTTSAASPTSRRASAEPIRPTPPVISTAAPLKATNRGSDVILTEFRPVRHAAKTRAGRLYSDTDHTGLDRAPLSASGGIEPRRDLVFGEQPLL